jgi:hypothetical protein
VYPFSFVIAPLAPTVAFETLAPGLLKCGVFVALKASAHAIGLSGQGAGL